MISRYSRKELVNIWSEENKYKIWLDVEIAAAEAMEKYKIIPRGVASIVKKKGKIKVKRIHDIEAKVKHDVIAFLTTITEQAGIKARYLHQGMTSSDVLDTSFNIQLVQSGNILLKDIDKILSVLKKQAKNIVFCDGNPKSKIMVIGEAPGANEDQEGLPFVGKAGMLLDKMLASIDLDRKKVYISNIINYRPTENRRPTEE